MSKFESLNTVMSLSEAKKYLEQISEDLDAIYLSAETPSGAAGTVWRQFWGSPRQITPLTLYLRQMIEEEIETSEILLKKQAKELKAKAKETLKQKLAREAQRSEDAEQFAVTISVEHDKLVEKSTKEHKELRRLQLINKAQNKPSMLDAQARDIAMLINRLSPYVRVELNELESYRLQQVIKTEIDEED